MSEPSEMPALKVCVQRASQLVENTGRVLANIRHTAAQQAAPKPVRLVAVSKLKPASDVLALHTTPIPAPTGADGQQTPQDDRQQLHFGENYVQELIEKAAVLPRSVRWHFIGGLQSNKCGLLASSVPNLWCVESVDSAKKADKLDAGRRACLAEHSSAADTDNRLRVMVQVNTSGEAEKSGCAPGDDTVRLCRHIVEQNSHLRLHGLMTIGAIARSMAAAGDDNADFVELARARDRVEAELGLAGLELSMGMSNDYEAAIRHGSDQVRVGSNIFGARPPKNSS